MLTNCVVITPLILRYNKVVFGKAGGRYGLNQLDVRLRLGNTELSRPHLD
jgi:hypothetical protein